MQLFAEILENDPPELDGQELRQPSRSSAYKALIDVGALAPARVADQVLCDACDEPHPIPVEHLGHGNYRAYCPVAGYQGLPASALRLYAASEAWVADAIASWLGFARRPNRPDSISTWIGKATFGPYDCHLFLACRLSEKPRYERVRSEIEALLGRSPGILITSTPQDLIPGERPRRCAIVPIEQAIRLEGIRTQLEEDLFYAALRGSTPHAGEPVGYSFSVGYRSARFSDQEYSFTDKQAQVVEALHQAWREGQPRMHQSEIQGSIGSSQRVGQLFRTHPAYGTLIRYDGGGYYWLDL